MADLIKSQELQPDRKQNNDAFSICSYVSNKQAQGNKILLEQNFINFLEKGEKVVHYANKATTITNARFAILSSDHCLMTEKLMLKIRH